ncbi:acyl-CoA thioesterase [Segetibacter sp. 3557_3]|uniref:acyl-CoA thioesterase n=1 Tax=Segetibacter sp. 3557_3 TaxID=2547429 RepID=UPI00105876D2|nr:acyl-CoA thioesterase [Segetibacter sp. 3557_3]TDH29074.1 acyl-CoA thioesterase [Segetibacter sp. 3557_3]
MEGYKPVAASQTTITELMIPSYSNFGGKVHGGTILSLMDKAAYACASKHAEAYCVTASIDTVDFIASVEVGELVSLFASVNYVGRTSLIVGIKAISENIKTQSVKHTNTSYFTMVAMDEQLKPVEVPGLILRTDDEKRRFYQAFRRKELKRNFRVEEARVKVEFDEAAVMDILKKERCILETTTSMV